MKSCIWRLAGFGLLGLSVSAQSLAEEPGSSPLQSKPDEVRQTQTPRRGYYQDIPRHWQAGGQGARHDDRRWPDRPDGRGNDYVYSGGYWYRPHGARYVVVAPPIGSYDVIAYPAYEQSPHQTDQDRYECHRWAFGQTGFDPAAATYAPPAYVADNYRRALGGCLSGRGYSVY
ncbi:hypothetical protein NVV94_23235 [Pseudomonas sp. LS1212]|uniref:hypothetical protein n=1 Tax=Pseudomonas sp. LS1212 TaxID=2972478 RepID=UPI00215C54E7|nr:hypothetical protein [Pseudomonas sp. LS1212]UVJ43433.1 hypothetical protein NVV94_23235 [Pseudomonas sp. LS1212]